MQSCDRHASFVFSSDSKQKFNFVVYAHYLFTCVLCDAVDAILPSCSLCKHAMPQVFFFFFCLLGINSQHHTRPGTGTAAFPVVFV